MAIVEKSYKPLIPISENQFLEASVGDKIMITLDGKSFWTVYNGQNGGKDQFLQQWRAQDNGDPDLVFVVESDRKAHQYDRNLGVIIGSYHNQTNYVGPLRQKGRYDDLVNRLKESEMWT